VLVEIRNFSKRGLTDFRLDFENLVLVKVNKNNKEGALNSLDAKSLKAPKTPKPLKCIFEIICSGILLWQTYL